VSAALENFTAALPLRI